MKFRAHIFQLNDDFSQEYADTHNNGEASELNRKYDWEDELSLKNDILKVEVLKDSSFVLAGELNGTPFEEEVKGMIVFQMEGYDGSVTQMACTQSILHDYEVEELEEELILRVYIKDYEPFANPIPGVYIASQDFPKKLIVE